MRFEAEEAPSSSTAAEDNGAAEHGAVAVGARKRTSLLRYSPAFILLAILIADSNRHTDPDLWGHLHFGQAFIAQGRLLRHDIYSYTAPGHRWGDHEWLAEVVMALVYNASGVVGLKLWKFVCSALTVVFIAETEAETGAGSTLQIAVTLGAAFGLILQSQFRPQMFTFVMLSGLLVLLTRDNYRRGASLWIAIPMMAVWANLHGGFFIGIAALAVYSGVATMCDLAAGSGWRRGLRLGALTAAAAVATLLNPYGFGMWETVAHALRNPYTRSIITDWHPLLYAMQAQWRSARSGTFLYADVIAMVLALGAAFAIEPRGDDLPLVAVAAMMACAAFLSVRNLALAAIAVSGPLARHVNLATRRWRAGIEPPPARRASQWLILALCAALAIDGGLLSSHLAPDQAYPAGALAFMRAHDLHGNVLAEFQWGEYVIWHAVPPDRVFIDGRYDTVYPLRVIGDYVKFYFDLPGASGALSAYPTDFVLIAPRAPAARLMARSGWKLLYRDGASLLYANAGSRAAHMPGLPVKGVAPAPLFP